MGKSAWKSLHFMSRHTVPHPLPSRFRLWQDRVNLLESEGPSTPLSFPRILYSAFIWCSQKSCQPSLNHGIQFSRQRESFSGQPCQHSPAACGRSRCGSQHGAAEMSPWCSLGPSSSDLGPAIDATSLEQQRPQQPAYGQALTNCLSRLSNRHGGPKVVGCSVHPEIFNTCSEQQGWFWDKWCSSWR